MTTEQLAGRDAYLRTCDAVVTEVTDLGVVLDRTVAYARGGGQPGDTGSIAWPGGSLNITDTFTDRASARLIHEVAGMTPEPGTEVTVTIDWDRRHTIMRTHTALHALSGIVFTEHGAKVTGGNMEPGGVARMDFELEAISQEFGREVEARLNEALADPDLIRTKVSLIPDHVDPIRVIDIEGIDKQADGGTHVRSTGEVGTVRVVKTESKGKANKRMRIQLEAP